MTRGYDLLRTQVIKPRKSLDELLFMREEIVALCAVKCRMSHERIVLSADSKLPVVSASADSGYRRIGLCGPEVRDRQLGCSHTMARTKLVRAIEKLRAQSGNEGDALDVDELNRLDNAIHLLDHAKGAAEARLAELLRTGDAGDQISHDKKLLEAAKTLRGMEQLHDEHVERIGILRDKVVTALDRLIENYRQRETSG